MKGDRLRSVATLLRIRSEEQAFAEAKARLGEHLAPLVLFLDFDGVLNSDAYLRSRGPREDDDVMNPKVVARCFDPAAVARLSKLVVDLGLEVVISSSWRHGWELDVLRSMLGRRGYKAGPFLGRTNPMAAHDTRALEIQEWLDGARAVGIRPRAYAIVDDDVDAGYGHEENFVRTAFATGLLDAEVEALRRIYLR